MKELKLNLKRTLKLGILLALISLLVSLFIGIYITKSISLPLSQLISGIKKIASGHLETEINLKTQGEFKKLAESFNNMAMKLRLRIEAINKLNSELEELNQSKDKYFSVIAHDLRNPFCAILGFSELLDEQYDEFNNKERKEIVKELNKASKNVFELLENLLTWSRAQTNRINFNFEKLYLNPIIENCIISHKGNADQKQISLKNNISDDLYFYGDKFSVGVIINNILSNAIKFTKEQGSISLAAQMLDNEVEIIIKDTGIGMDNEIINSLLQSNKVDSQPGTRNEKGTGLGLLLIKEFVEKNKGRIAVKSALGEGTEFRFFLIAATKQS